VAVFWRPEIIPATLVLERAPDCFTAAWPFDVKQLGGTSVERVHADGRHMIVRGEGSEFRLWARDSRPSEPLAIIIPLDDDLPVRAAAALRLWTRIVGNGPARDDKFGSALTRQRRERLVLMLRALDGHLTDASYREIAEAFFGAQRVQRDSWKTLSLRDQTIRLVKGGVELMRAGYRKLLRGR
jgi:hypothetical protein